MNAQRNAATDFLIRQDLLDIFFAPESDEMKLMMPRSQTAENPLRKLNLPCESGPL
jgi:hypothetical protein